jgi:hypothetical protein
MLESSSGFRILDQVDVEALKSCTTPFTNELQHRLGWQTTTLLHVFTGTVDKAFDRETTEYLQAIHSWLQIPNSTMRFVVGSDSPHIRMK